MEKYLQFVLFPFMIINITCCVRFPNINKRKGVLRMKKIETIIRPEKFQPLRNALSSIGIGGLTVTEAAGTGKQKGQTGVFRGTTFQIQLLPKIKVEMIVEDNQLDEIVSIILETCSTGNIGDGKIFVSSVEEVIRIRTGERGNEAVI